MMGNNSLTGTYSPRELFLIYTAKGDAWTEAAESIAPGAVTARIPAFCLDKARDWYSLATKQSDKMTKP